MRKLLNIEGMSCNHCVMHVKNALMDIEGVKGCQVSLSSNTAEVDMDKNIDEEVLIKAVEDAGYNVNSIENV
jgi:copper ion binding protein